MSIFVYMYLEYGASLVAHWGRICLPVQDVEGGRSPGEGNGNPHQYSCLGNPMDRGAWRAAVHGVENESDMI